MHFARLRHVICYLRPRFYSRENWHFDPSLNYTWDWIHSSYFIKNCCMRFLWLIFLQFFYHDLNSWKCLGNCRLGLLMVPRNGKFCGFYSKTIHRVYFKLIKFWMIWNQAIFSKIFILNFFITSCIQTFTKIEIV